ncbi:SUMO-activating enzyme subunit 2 [Episyrphus balteatus]|uniref:SUMO-activating enzyme subunit 2 n=1 Tax=Episyrphus balteatus TaxID=286459 RepID=UPI002484DAA2|nr:SUMO-activating enzyme subunit 2 [Episyrphus balteatus]
MAAALPGVFPANLQEKIVQSKILVVGAGGIGCEILKNLVLSGFPDIEIIDLDTIDLSNLNRQFLFHKEHVGKSKAEVAKESALKFNPTVKIKSYHDSIFNTDYGVSFFKKFNVVLNALDNRQARNHVNRMCLNAEVPLIESGTAGYNGQVELIKKGVTQCYECTPKAAQKSFPGCTIRNTPSEPIHCIVWAKHLFNQLFGETADDEDISPDVADPEAGVGDQEDPEEGDVKRVSTRKWAEEAGYDAETLFNKFFFDDINYLLSMSNLWKTRKPPSPLKWDSVLLDEVKNSDNKEFLKQYHKVWSFAESAAVFADCVQKLKIELAKSPDNEKLVWDKDDQPAMDFVAACANIRANIFEIAQKSRFEIKSMAGNIIPAIATTNAITAGVVVLHTFRALQDEFDKCKSVYMRLRPNPRNQLLVPEKFLTPPNPKCYVCSSDPAIDLKVDTNKIKIKDLRDDILIKALGMVNPDVIIDTKGVIVISSEEGETECNDDKTMTEMGITDGALLKVDDFFQNYELSIIVWHMDAERDGPLFEVIADKDQLKPQEESVPEKTNGTKRSANDDADDGPSTSKKSRIEVVEDDDDLCLIEDDDEVAVVEEKKEEPKVVENNSTEKVEASPAKNNANEKESASSTPAKSSSSSSASVATKRKPTANDDDSIDGPSNTKRTKQDDDDDDVTIID